MSPTVSTPEKTDSAPRHKRFRLLAVGVGLLPLLILEAVLRLAGIQPAGHDPFAEFGGNVPAFLRDGDRYQTNPAREPYLSQQSFAADKPTNTRRVFCFGGSTVHGRPFQPDTAFPAWLDIELSHRAPSHEWEVINCGGISYASYRIVPMVREAIAYEPDLIIVATGHNEFLEDRTYTAAKQRGPIRRALDQLRTVRLARHWLQPPPATQAREMELKTRLDESSGYASYHRDEGWSRRVEQQFGDALAEISRTCRKADVPLMFVNLGSNLRDCPPYKSEHRKPLSPDDESAWQTAFEEGTRHQVEDPKAALSAYRRALAIDDQFALLHYRIAKLLDRTGSIDATTHYQLARDLDVCPLRMTSGIQAQLIRVAEQDQIPLVDVAQAISSLCNPSPPGFDWYLDHVHPTVGAHQLIAQVLATHVATNAAMDPPVEFKNRTELYTKHMTMIGPRYFSNGRRRLEWLENWARREKLLDENEPFTANDHIRLAIRRLDFDDLDGAWESLVIATKLDLNHTREAIGRITANLERQGRYPTATKLIQRSETGRSVP